MNITKWMDKIAENANKEVAKILVANKCDLDGKRKLVKKPENHSLMPLEFLTLKLVPCQIGT